MMQLLYLVSTYIEIMSSSNSIFLPQILIFLYLLYNQCLLEQVAVVSRTKRKEEKRKEERKEGRKVK